MARILIVDDQAVNRELIVACLEGCGHELVEAGSGEEALALSASRRPDLVLLDVMMPGLDGFEVTRRLKEVPGHDFLPVILVTSLGDKVSRLRGLEAGADEFLTKPVDREELLLRLKNLLALRDKDQELGKTNVALAELLRYKDDMSALIVHDLKNPMAVLLANYDYIMTKLADAEPDLLEALEDSHAAADRVMRIIANLLDLTQLENNRLSLRRHPVPLASMLAEVAHTHRQVAQARKIDLTTQADDDLVLDVDADLVSRVLENIADNACRFTPAGGRIHLTAGGVNGDVFIRIGNTGPSIPLASRSLIFEKFGQASESHGRTNLGLGLYFCRLAIEAHGGRIWVEETPVHPTVFVIKVPAARPHGGGDATSP